MTRAPITFKFNGKKLAEFWMQGDAFPSNVFPLLEDFIKLLKPYTSAGYLDIEKADLLVIVKEFASENGLDTDPSMADYYYSCDISNISYLAIVKAFNKKCTIRHSDSGNIDKIMDLPFYRNATGYELVNNNTMLVIKQNDTELGFYNNYTNKNPETDFFSYVITKKGKLIDTKYPKF